MKVRHDLKFFIITKSPNRFFVSLPNDWEDRYDNVEIACSVENQEMANFRLPIFCKLPIKHQYIIVVPILENIILLPFWDKTIESVAVGGESGKCARVCDFNWILNIREQCVKADVHFLLH